MTGLRAEPKHERPRRSWTVAHHSHCFEMCKGARNVCRGQAIMVSWVWTSMALEESVFSSTVLAFSLSLCTSLVAVALFTRDLVLAFYVCLNILLVVCVLSGCLLKLRSTEMSWGSARHQRSSPSCSLSLSPNPRNVLDYDFGVVEAIGATIFVGLSVDYCLHLAHGPPASPEPGCTSP